MRIYLAGGMRSNWQDRVIAALSNHTFFDSRTHGLVHEQDYTAWDLQHIQMSDVVFAYMEADNPSGVGLALELGFAFALGKFIMFVDSSAPDKERYFGMCRSVSDKTFRDLDDGIDHLVQYQKLFATLFTREDTKDDN